MSPFYYTCIAAFFIYKKASKSEHFPIMPLISIPPRNGDLSFLSHPGLPRGTINPGRIKTRLIKTLRDKAYHCSVLERFP